MKLPKSYSDLQAYPPIYRGPCTTIVVVAPGIILKWCPINDAEEVHVLHFARRHLIPVPRVIHHPTLRRRISYFCMEHCRGVSLDKVIDSSDLSHIADQLSSILTRMSSIKNQPFRNFFYPPSFEPKHPFCSVGEFYDYYREMLRWCCTDEWLDAFFHRLPRNDAIHFVHGDLVPPNIMVEGSTITGIIDWASGGFHPSHWEYCRMWQYTSSCNWSCILERVCPLQPRRTEIEAHRKLISMLANDF